MHVIPVGEVEGIHARIQHSKTLPCERMCDVCLAGTRVEARPILAYLLRKRLLSPASVAANQPLPVPALSLDAVFRIDYFYYFM